MSILVNKNTRVLVQGITGSAGQLPRASRCSSTARRSSRGVTPGKGGETLRGQVPIFDTVDAGGEGDRRQRVA